MFDYGSEKAVYGLAYPFSEASGIREARKISALPSRIAVGTYSHSLSNHTFRIQLLTYF